MGEKSRMNTVVFFQDLTQFHEALHYFDLDSFSGKNVPVKLHMGESKNKYFPRPAFVKHIIDELKTIPAFPYLFDTTVCYSGLRNSKKGYLKLSQTHGFTKEKIGCEVIIDDQGISTSVQGREYEIAQHLDAATHIFAISHVKGHIATGMGGAIKNFGMGGVTKETKLSMHQGSRPIWIKDDCTYCGKCAQVCPFNALAVTQNSWEQVMKKCFGCGVCVDNCVSNAMEYTDADLQFVLACAAKACVQNKTVLYLNELKRIAKSCDCDPDAGPIICPDVGYLLSDDPVAIDKASLDLIEQIKPQVFEIENHINPYKQITFGEKIGLGFSTYNLIEI